jgi:hypothetical protein
MIIQIPITTANLKYLRYRYQIIDVFAINRIDPLSTFLQELMKPKPRIYHPMNFEGMPVLNVQLLSGHDYSYLVHFPSSLAPLFNQYIKDLIQLEFIAHMEALEGLIEHRESICQFIDKYGFDEHEVSFEALKKRYLRYRNRLAKVKPIHSDDVKCIIRNPQLSLFAEKTA